MTLYGPIRDPAEVVFGDDWTLNAFRELVRVARAKQTTRYAVAPRRSVVTRNGILRGGSPVTLADLDGADVSKEARLARLIDREIIIERRDIDIEEPIR